MSTRTAVCSASDTEAWKGPLMNGKARCVVCGHMIPVREAKGFLRCHWTRGSLDWHTPEGGCA